MCIIEGRVIGVDLGQRRDYAAIAVVERVVTAGEWDAVMYGYHKEAELRVRHVERIALGTSYVAVVERVREVAMRVDGKTLVVDATGVGGPVVDMLRAARTGCKLMPVMITGGMGEGSEGGYYRTPKRELVVGLEVMLQRKQLKIAGGMEWGEALMEEFGALKVRAGDGGREQFGAWGAKEHDDLVLAVALACWGLKKVYGVKLAGRVGYCRRDGVNW